MKNFNFFYSKKSIVGISTYLLVLVILLSVTFFTYETYKKFGERNVLEKTKHELINSGNSFRSELINIIIKENSSLNYSNSFDEEDIEFVLSGKSILASKIVNEKEYSRNISSLGMRFCGEYIISPKSESSFFFNGTCIALS